ncbi:MAG: class I SAM-dependent methyltransferase [Dongiaceae bacterium]
MPHGCDLALHRKDRPILNNPDRFREIPALPYAIPFADGTFSIVVSASVLEHAKNPAECFKEIHRVLKPGGCALHLFPGKWYLPCEPHTLVPMANYFFPHCPRWWFALWAALGMSGPSRDGRGWREAARMSENYYRTGLFYMSSGDHRRLSRAVFGNCDWPMEFYIAHAQGGMARLCRSLPLPELWGILSREFRMAFMMQRKVSEAARTDDRVSDGP